MKDGKAPPVKAQFASAASGKPTPRAKPTVASLKATQPPKLVPNPPASVRRAVDRQVREQQAASAAKAKAIAKAQTKERAPLTRQAEFNEKSKGTLSGSFNHASRKR